MEIEIVDKSLMMIFLLEVCDSTCPHCIREDEPMPPGYKLSLRQLRSCLSDCRGLERIDWIHFSGGEPTLWREGGRDLVDLLLEISDAGFTPGFTTNGNSFRDYDRCLGFFRRYVDASTTPLRLYLSIDTFHQNFDPATGRAESLDNVMRCKQEMPRDKGSLLDTRVIVVVSKELDSLLPEGLVAHYESRGVAFQFVPLHPWGRARSMSHFCPDLDSDNPDDLGAYYRVCRKEGPRKAEKIAAGDRTAHTILIGDDYYALIDDDDLRSGWRKVARLGQLPDAMVRAYSAEAGT